jgi:hypothetical protein
MIAAMRHAGLIALAAGFIAGPAVADSIDNAGPAQAAGPTAYSGSTRSPSGIDTETSSDMAHSVAALPDEDQTTPQANGPTSQPTCSSCAPWFSN